MSTCSPEFALIGRSFPSEIFERLYEASLIARRSRMDKAKSWNNAMRGDRAWRGSGQRVDVPMRLPG